MNKQGQVLFDIVEGSPRYSIEQVQSSAYSVMPSG